MRKYVDLARELPWDDVVLWHRIARPGSSLR
jgi:hypothetical protein